LVTLLPLPLLHQVHHTHVSALHHCINVGGRNALHRRAVHTRGGGRGACIGLLIAASLRLCATDTAASRTWVSRARGGRFMWVPGPATRPAPALCVNNTLSTHTTGHGDDASHAGGVVLRQQGAARGAYRAPRGTGHSRRSAHTACVLLDGHRPAGTQWGARTAPLHPHNSA
jgi:hypothetical protein